MTAGFQPQGALAPAELIRLQDALANCKFDTGEGRGADVFNKFGQLLTLLVKKERDLVLTPSHTSPS